MNLTPVKDGDIFMLFPQCRRRYRLNLAGATYGDDKEWGHLQLVLPPASASSYENWVHISCHAPLRSGRAVPIDWGNSESYYFVGGKIPEITTGDFDIVCSFSPNAGKWMVGVVQYSPVEVLA